MRKFVLLCIICFIFLSCPTHYNYNWKLYINPGLYNLSGMNTQYNDFNAAPPPVCYFSQNIIYSTDYGSSGDDLDIYTASIDFDIVYPGTPDGGDITVTLEENDITSIKGGPYLDGAYNTIYDERGPYILDTYTNLQDWYYDPDDVLADSKMLYLFASNTGGGDFDIFFINQSSPQEFCGNTSDSDDFYPTYHKETGTLYFCSNRDGVYDIFSYTNSSGAVIDNFLGDTLQTDDLLKVDSLNTVSNEMCPYIVGNIMVFISDREDTNDIYYSIYEDSDWSAPVNMDTIYEGINSSYQEFRPSLFKAYIEGQPDSEYKVLIFSSDRPGGAGGFDLYLCILPLDAFL